MDGPASLGAHLLHASEFDVTEVYCYFAVRAARVCFEAAARCSASLRVVPGLKLLKIVQNWTY
jgi:hypothetical protein